VCRYAAKVARGYRPAKPKAISAGVWQLVEACWQQEPCARPSMAKVGRCSNIEWIGRPCQLQSFQKMVLLAPEPTDLL
jgi:hypothetical protein